VTEHDGGDLPGIGWTLVMRLMNLRWEIVKSPHHMASLVNEAPCFLQTRIMHHFTAFSTWLHNFTLLHLLQARRLPSLSTTINKVLLSSTAILSA
jgi:hypothetical protein